MRFPSVTICNQNRIKESLILDNNATRFKDLADIGRLFEGCKGHGWFIAYILKAATALVSRSIIAGKGLLRDCENFAGVLFAALVLGDVSQAAAPGLVPGPGSGQGEEALQRGDQWDQGQDQEGLPGCQQEDLHHLQEQHSHQGSEHSQ